MLFHDSETTAFYFLQDLAFVPVQIVTVTIILNRFLNMIEDKKKAKKINVIISTFFVDAGISILAALAAFNENNEELSRLFSQDGFDRRKAAHLKKQVREFDYDIRVTSEKLMQLAETMDRYRDYTLNMLGNDNLLEHDSFTDMLWAAFHVADELKTRRNTGSQEAEGVSARRKLDNLGEDDLAHLQNDILRAYTAMTVEWVNYMVYLREGYPFLYALAVEKNPYKSGVSKAHLQNSTRQFAQVSRMRT
ncbi:hypothetical protein [Anaerobium acetethylicum]|uniref:Uncharacterized protein n=1 Tax=Anaerobium acetethylicum TaxID=1619234 RepID=A0A1D3TVN6_9FIRM|nr:hypothetical protein [Anaerobium acetethylicum]SCP98224.1 hypothetical protein SAMN05421730_101814 [Anaerobium acetethylicum]